MNHFITTAFRGFIIPLFISLFLLNQAVAETNEEKLIALSNWAAVDYSHLFNTSYTGPKTGHGYLYTCFSNNNCIGLQNDYVDILLNGVISRVGTIASVMATMEAATKPKCATIFPMDNPWNTDISNYPVHPNSDAYIASIGSKRHTHADFGTVWNGAPNGIPVVEVNDDTPRRTVDFQYSSESDHALYPIPDNPPIEGGPDGKGDRHIIMLDRKACKLYELYAAWPPGSKNNNSQDNWFAGSGAIFDLTSNQLRGDYITSADAAGLPIFPGLTNYEEANIQKEIRHALRFTAKKTQKAYIHPATHYASKSTDPNLPPMGLRVRLKKDYDISGFAEEVQVILKALKKYGMFLADNGGDWFISGMPDSRWNDENLSQFHQIPGSAYEAVDTGELVLPRR